MNNNYKNSIFWDKISNKTNSNFDVLSSSLSADIAIVGGGIVGLSIAIEASNNGYNVVVLEKCQIGNGSSGLNSGFIVPKLRPLTINKSLNQLLGEENSETFLKLVSASGQDIFNDIKRHKIQCQLNTNGWISAAHTPEISNSQIREYSKEEYKKKDVQLLSKKDLQAMSGFDHWCGGILYKSAGSLNPKAYNEGLSEVAASRGIKIFENSYVKKIEEKNNKVYLSVNNKVVNAKKLILATNALTGNLHPLVSKSFMKINIYQGVTYQLPDELRKYILPSNSVITDTSPVQIAFRWTPDNRILTGGVLRLGIGKRLNLAKYVFRKRLENIFAPISKNYNIPPNFFNIEFVWSGPIALTNTGMPKIIKISNLTSAIISCNGRGVALGTSIGKLYGRYLTNNISLKNRNLIDSITCLPSKYFMGNLLKYGTPIWALWNEIKQRASNFLIQ